MSAADVAAFAVGGIALLATLLLGDVGGGHDVGHDGLPFLSLTSLEAAVLGAGTGGLLSTWAASGIDLAQLLDRTDTAPPPTDGQPVSPTE